MNKFIKLAGLIFIFGLFCFSLPAQKEVRSAATDFVLAWSTDSYIPPDYQGKALPTMNSRIKVVAIPTAKSSQNPDFYNYRWFLDEDIMGWASGKGKSSFTFTATKRGGENHLVELQVLDNSGNAIFTQTLYIKIVSPEIVLTKNGEFLTDGQTYPTQSGKTLDFRAIPLFFTFKNVSDLKFNWSVDDLDISDNGDKNPEQLSLSIPKTNAGSSIIKSLYLNIVDKSNELLRADTNIRLEIN